MSDTVLITIVGLSHYYGKKPFEIGRTVRLVKDKANNYDSEAILVELPVIGKIGYVANSTNTVYQGTYSAGRLYDKIGDTAFARVLVITHSSVIAEIVKMDSQYMEMYDMLNMKIASESDRS